MPASLEVCSVVVVGGCGDLTDCARRINGDDSESLFAHSYYYRPLSGTMYYLMSCHSMK